MGSTAGLTAREIEVWRLIATGLDPKGLVVPEVAYLRQAGRYTSAVAGFGTGTVQLP